MSPSPEAVLNLLGIDYQLKSGRLAFRCPIHDDRDPSAAFYLDTNLGHCFSCGYTVDPLQFYAKATGKTRERARRDLERSLGQTIEETTRTADPLTLARARRRGEQRLRALRARGLPRRLHAKEGETLDRILLAYERGQIDEPRLDKLLKIWYNNHEEHRNGFHADRTPEAGPDDRLEEGPRNLPGTGPEGDGPDLEFEPAEDPTLLA